MRALLITGKLAYPIVKEVLKKVSNVDATIKSLNYPVASLMSVRYILENIKNDNLKDFDIIILPGLVFGDAKIIEEETGVKTVKGTENAWDIPLVFEALNQGIQLSTIYPADKILGKVKMEKMLKTLEKIEENQEVAFEQGIKIPLRPPPFRVFLELDPTWPIDRILEEIERTREFVDVYVIGFPVGHDNLDDVRLKIRKVKDTGVIIGIDSDSPRELIEGIKEGVDFVFNINEANYEKLIDVKNKAAFVVAPFNVENKSDIVIKLAKILSCKGFNKLILDAVLSPPLQGMVESIIEYKKIREALPQYPLLMGALNVTELIDADSHGMNALLTAIAGELGISSILTMEKGKTRWSSWEIKEASKMVSISLLQKRSPKDLGIDLLILKDKAKYKENEELNNIIFVDHNEPEMDSAGFAKVFLNNGKIALTFYGKNNVTLVGDEALSIGRELVRRVNISKQHAVYIGYELAKAEIARNLDKNYIQDLPLFKKIH
ncbi:dihydropteroate synthase-like protein [Acidianus sp. HS-5]|uniref:dihydropteroate synthase-like protein n=1 Tax=Acidianus sp. HS-5 TaxID=2886040 RepID=UPI001F3E6F08|nr:dihydropteroate synthase-like protein [Acidianus sp. HS-5]